MVLATNLGFPRVGLKRELKTALEAYWSGKQVARIEITKALDLVDDRHAGAETVEQNTFKFKVVKL